MNQFKFPSEQGSPLSRSPSPQAPRRSTTASAAAATDTPLPPTSMPPGYVGAVDEEGRPHGFGVQRYSDGSRYEGNFARGALHGTGTYRYASGASYVGRFHEGKREGAGTYHFADGTVYEGSYLNDRREGQGRIRFSEAAGLALAKQAAALPEDSPLTKVVGTLLPRHYEGGFVANAMHGDGTMQYSNGAMYTGTMAANQAHGRGVLTAPGGNFKVEGTFSGGVPTGPCVLARGSDTLAIVVDPNGRVAPQCTAGAGAPCTFANGTHQCAKCGAPDSVLSGWLQAASPAESTPPQSDVRPGSVSRPRSARTRQPLTTFVGETTIQTPPRQTQPKAPTSPSSRPQPEVAAKLRRLWDDVLTAVTIAKQATRVGFGMAVADCRSSKNGNTTVVRVVQIAPRTPASNHGFARGDYIHSVNGVPIRTARDFARLQLVPGETALIVATRRAQHHSHMGDDDTFTATAADHTAAAAVEIPATVGCTLTTEDMAAVDQAAAEAMAAMLQLDSRDAPPGGIGNDVEYVTRLVARLTSLEQTAQPRVWPKRR